MYTYVFFCVTQVINLLASTVKTDVKNLSKQKKNVSKSVSDETIERSVCKASVVY